MQRPIFFALILVSVLIGSASSLLSLFAPVAVALCFLLRKALNLEGRPKFFVLLTVGALFVLCLGSELALNWSQGVVLRGSAGMLLFLLCLRTLSHSQSSARMQVGVVAILPIAVALYRLDAIFSIPLLLVFLILYAAFLVEQACEQSSAGLHFGRTGTPTTRLYFSLTKRHIIFTLLFACLVFSLLPRVGNDLANANQNPRSAYNEGNLDLQKSGQVQTDPLLLFSANAPPLPEGYYWRMQTQSRFDGKRWLNDVYHQEPVQNPTDANLLSQRTLQNEQESVIEFSKPWPFMRVPSLGHTLSLTSLDTQQDPTPTFKENAAGTWYRANPRRYQSITSYAITWEPSDTLHSTNNEYTSSMIWPYGDKREPKITQLARRIVGNETQTLQMAQRIAQYLRANYQYSLNLPPRGRWPVSDFLFEQKSGHCEIFAASMAALLSSLGVQSRLVTGFYSAEYRNGRNYVRNAHAHAWVEVYDMQGAWVRFDPTASSAGFATPSRLVLINDWFANYQNSVLFRWLRYNWPKAILMLLMTLSASIAFAGMRRWPQKGAKGHALISIALLCAALVFSIFTKALGLYLFCLHPFLFLAILIIAKLRKPNHQRLLSQHDYQDYSQKLIAFAQPSLHSSQGLEAQLQFVLQQNLPHSQHYLQSYARMRFGAASKDLRFHTLRALYREATRELKRAP